MGSLTKHMLVHEVSNKTAIVQKDIDYIITTSLQEIINGLDIYKQVVLHNFGTFKIVDAPERNCRNPQTGELMTVPAKKKIKFIPTEQWKDAVNQ